MKIIKIRTLQLGRKYRITLKSGRSVILIHHGGRLTNTGKIYTITVNGKIGQYSDVYEALGLGTEENTDGIASVTNV
jgi:hypothetical protein